jgi:hypothetical protein
VAVAVAVAQPIPVNRAFRMMDGVRGRRPVAPSAMPCRRPIFLATRLAARPSRLTRLPAIL